MLIAIFLKNGLNSISIINFDISEESIFIQNQMDNVGIIRSFKFVQNTNKYVLILNKGAGLELNILKIIDADGSMKFVHSKSDLGFFPALSTMALIVLNDVRGIAYF